MNELSLVLQKEQEVKEKIETAKKNAELILQEKKTQLEKKLGGVFLDPQQEAQINSTKQKKLQAIEKKFQEKTQELVGELEKTKKENFNKASQYVVERILCLK